MKEDSILTGFAATAGQKLRIVELEMPADMETPVSAFLKLRDFGAKILLESVESGTVLGRYSFVGVSPDSKIIVNRDHLKIENGADNPTIAHNGGSSPLSILSKILSRFSIEASPRHPRLLGGIVGYISYDFARFFERIPDLSRDTLGLPLAILYLIDTLLVFDHVQRRLKVMCLTTESSSRAADEKLAQIVELLRAPVRLPVQQTVAQSGNQLVSNLTEAEFCKAVLEVKRHITAGDVYQQVISRRLQGSTQSDPFMIYRALRMLNPSPYMYFLDFGEIKLVGSSPEALVRLENGVATVRPIAGTRPRGKEEEEDNRLAEELLRDEKERAEHVMLVDLGRNDLGRCSEIGTVRVTDFMKVERYSHVMHLTSNVIGKLKKGLDQFDLFQATFPAGTVTGAPKIRSMQLIEELENTRRGPYAGAVGYFSLSGDMDWCITIRTIIMKGKNYFLQAGAGIVADSVPEKEFQETQDKIAALKKAVETAEKGF